MIIIFLRVEILHGCSFWCFEKQNAWQKGITHTAAVPEWGRVWVWLLFASRVHSQDRDPWAMHAAEAALLAGWGGFPLDAQTGTAVMTYRQCHPESAIQCLVGCWVLRRHLSWVCGHPSRGAFSWAHQVRDSSMQPRAGLYRQEEAPACISAQCSAYTPQGRLFLFLNRCWKISILKAVGALLCLPQKKKRPSVSPETWNSGSGEVWVSQMCWLVARHCLRL